MMQYFTNVARDITKDSQSSVKPNRKITNKSMPRNTKSNPSKTNDKQKLLKSAREKRIIACM